MRTSIPAGAAVLLICLAAISQVAPAAGETADPAEIRRTNPDLIVYDPTGGAPRPWSDPTFLWLNEHVLVQTAKDGALLATWTSEHLKSGTSRIAFSRSTDGGATWTPAELLADERAAWQVPVIAPSGRVYLLYTHGGFDGGLRCRVSDDHGVSWGPTAELPFPKTTLDSHSANPMWISCTVPHWDANGRPLIAYTHWAKTGAVPAGNVGITERYCCIELMRIGNLAESPGPSELEITWLNPDDPVTVPHEGIDGASFAQEPYIVDLPDGRMFMAMRTNRGEIWYTVSDSQGETWRPAEPMRYHDHGDVLQQPVSPCPIFSLERGDYLLLFNNNDGFVYGSPARWHVKNRRPAYICRGEFRPDAHQPLWWSTPLLFVDNAGVPWNGRHEAAPYVSLTEHKNRRVLWYPDRKGFVLGKDVPDTWLDQLGVLQGPFRALPQRPSQAGLRYTYYEGTWEELPDFATQSPAAEGVTECIGLGIAKRDEYYALRLTGLLQIPLSGCYTFWLGSDDGSRLVLDGETLIDNDGVHGSRCRQSSAVLEAGTHAFEVEYFQGRNLSRLEVEYEGPGIARQGIPPAALSHIPD